MVWSKRVQHYLVPSATQLLGDETTENGQTPHKTRDKLPGIPSELQEETMQLAQLLGSISMTSTILEYLANSYVLPKMAEEGVYPKVGVALVLFIQCTTLVLYRK